HRAVDLAAVLEQRHLMDAGVEQLAPRLPEPGLRVGLRRERLRCRCSRGADDRAGLVLVSPGPGHGGRLSFDAGAAVWSHPPAQLHTRRAWEAGRIPALTRNRRPPLGAASRTARPCANWLLVIRRGLRGGARVPDPQP